MPKSALIAFVLVAPFALVDQAGGQQAWVERKTESATVLEKSEQRGQPHTYVIRQGAAKEGEAIVTGAFFLANGEPLVVFQLKHGGIDAAGLKLDYWSMSGSQIPSTLRANDPEGRLKVITTAIEVGPDRGDWDRFTRRTSTPPTVYEFQNADRLRIRLTVGPSGLNAIREQ